MAEKFTIPRASWVGVVSGVVLLVLTLFKAHCSKNQKRIHFYNPTRRENEVAIEPVATYRRTDEDVRVDTGLYHPRGHCQAIVEKQRAADISRVCRPGERRNKPQRDPRYVKQKLRRTDPPTVPKVAPKPPPRSCSLQSPTRRLSQNQNYDSEEEYELPRCLLPYYRESDFPARTHQIPSNVYETEATPRSSLDHMYGARLEVQIVKEMTFSTFKPDEPQKWATRSSMEQPKLVFHDIPYIPPRHYKNGNQQQDNAKEPDKATTGDLRSEDNLPETTEQPLEEHKVDETIEDIEDPVHQPSQHDEHDKEGEIQEKIVEVDLGEI